MPPFEPESPVSGKTGDYTNSSQPLSNYFAFLRLFSSGLQSLSGNSGIDPSPPDGGGYGGRCEYIPVRSALGIHASHARRTLRHPAVTHMVRN